MFPRKHQEQICSNTQSRAAEFTGALSGGTEKKSCFCRKTGEAEKPQAFPEYELHIFGIGELEEALKAQVLGLQLEDKIIFRGFSANVREEILDSAMFVLSSDYEGISNSMIEALAMGIPVISTDCPVGGSRAYIENESSGLLVPVGDRTALCNAVKIRETYALSKIADRFLKEAGIS